jgi:hypothetical protein
MLAKIHPARHFLSKLQGRPLLVPSRFFSDEPSPIEDLDDPELEGAFENSDPQSDIPAHVDLQSIGYRDFLKLKKHQKHEYYNKKFSALRVSATRIETDRESLERHIDTLQQFEDSGPFST